MFFRFPPFLLLSPFFSLSETDRPNDLETLLEFSADEEAETPDPFWLRDDVVARVIESPEKTFLEEKSAKGVTRSNGLNHALCVLKFAK